MNSLDGKKLISELQRRACLFFVEKADKNTCLVSDRANNFEDDCYSVSSIASTGYSLIALTISVENRYISRYEAYQQATTTLKYFKSNLQNVEGWYYHFINKQSGIREWHCEISSIDTAIFILGALICAQYFKSPEIQDLANFLYDRVNWQWMLTNNGEQSDKLLLAHGWKPETGFLKYNWDTYCEHMFLYLAGMGARYNSLSSRSWEMWDRPIITFNGSRTLSGGPIFIHQMAHGFYNFQNKVDRCGWNYWDTSVQATKINREYCQKNSNQRKTFSEDLWGINAGDFPGGYKAFSAPGDEDGTVSPSGAIASIIFTPELSIDAATNLYRRYKDEVWGRYGFSNGLNIDKGWFASDVIGIDLGMLVVNIENWKTGMIWELLASHPSTKVAWEKAGFRNDNSH